MGEKEGGHNGHLIFICLRLIFENRNKVHLQYGNCHVSSAETANHLGIRVFYNYLLKFKKN
jgi:hypothetical protein